MCEGVSCFQRRGVCLVGSMGIVSFVVLLFFSSAVVSLIACGCVFMLCMCWCGLIWMIFCMYWCMVWLGMVVLGSRTFSMSAAILCVIVLGIVFGG